MAVSWFPSINHIPHNADKSQLDHCECCLINVFILETLIPIGAPISVPTGTGVSCPVRAHLDKNPIRHRCCWQLGANRPERGGFFLRVV